MTKCNHEHKEGIVCGQESDHALQHRSYEEGVSTVEDGIPCTSFTIHEWTDDSKKIPAFVENGNTFQINYDKGHDERAKIMDIAIAEARATLEIGEVFEIRTKMLPETLHVDFGRTLKTREEIAANWGICWYQVPKQKYYENHETATEPLFRHDIDEGETSELKGYMLVARIKV